MNTYSFKTKDNFRIDVEASTPQAGYNKIMSIPFLRMKGVTTEYIKYGNDGFGAYNWKFLEGGGN